MNPAQNTQDQLDETLDAEALTEINKQIFEIKKKIQLSEGQRKALFESCDAERKANADQILRLKREIAEFSSEIKSGRGRVDLKEIPYKLSECLPPVVANKRFEEVNEMIDLQIIDLKKKLDVLRYEAKQKQRELKIVVEKCTILAQKQLNSKSGNILPDDHPLILKKIELENEIHRIELQTSEASHIKRKYSGIKYHLITDSVRFENTLKNLEEEIKQQQKEILRLQEINNEASSKRDEILKILEDEQKAALEISKRHEIELNESKRKVEMRRQELRKLERRIVQDSVKSGTSVKPGSEPNSDEDDQDQDEVNENNAELEAACEKLKEATGALSISEVLKHFQVQRETFSNLKTMRAKTEGEKEAMEQMKQKMACELELYKFASDKDNDLAVAKILEMEKGIQEEADRLREMEEEIETGQDALCLIAKVLGNLCVALRCTQFETDANDNIKESDYENEPPGKPDFMDELLKMLYQRMHILLNETGIDGRDSALEEETGFKVMEEIRFEQPKQKFSVEDDLGLFPPSYTTLAGKSPASMNMKQHTAAAAAGTASEDEDDVPTRGYLKRQAQLIVDAKSRRKTFKLMIPSRK